MAPVDVREKLEWPLVNETRWYVGPCTGDTHRFLINANVGLYFENHASSAEQLAVESSFLATADWSPCHYLSRWFCGKLKMVECHIVFLPEEGHYGILSRFGDAASFDKSGFAAPKAQFETKFFTDSLGAVFFRNFVRVIDGPSARVLWNRKTPFASPPRSRL